MSELTIWKNENNSERVSYLSKRIESAEDRVAVFNGIENADVLLNDVVGATFILKDYYIEKIPFVDETTGEAMVKYRTILFDSEGKTYATGAYGIYNILSRIVSMFGDAREWGDGLKVKVVKKPVKDGKTSLSLQLV